MFKGAENYQRSGGLKNEDICCITKKFCINVAYPARGRGGELKCYRYTDIQTDPPTKRVLEEHSLLKKARNQGTVEKRIANSDGRTDELTDWRTDGLTD